MHDHEHDDWYDYNSDMDECMAEETLLEKLEDKIEHEVLPLCFELVESMFPNSLDLILADLTSSLASPCLMHEF